MSLELIEIALKRHWAERVEQQNEEMESVDRLVTVQELANYLGLPVATIYAWRYRHRGPPGFRVGRHLRFRWSDVDSWIQDRITETRHD